MRIRARKVFGAWAQTSAQKSAETSEETLDGHRPGMKPRPLQIKRQAPAENVTPRAGAWIKTIFFDLVEMLVYTRIDRPLI